MIGTKEYKYILVVLFCKLLILSFLPLTGDEAYFIKWGENLDWGYYDHPPMVGWLIYLMSFISDSFIFYRFFSFFTVLALAYLLYKIAIEFNFEKEKAKLVGILFLVSPIDVLILLFSNDVPLVLFGTLGTLFLIYSLNRSNWFIYSIFSGVFFGLAFLSKYFAAFLMISLLVYSLWFYRLKSIKNIVVITLVIGLFIFQNLYYNCNNCWNNIIFNFFARTKDSSFSISSILTYFGFIIYFFTPWGLYYLLKVRKAFSNKGLNLFIISIFGFIFSLFFIVSLKNTIGLHWFLLFTPYMFLFFLYLKLEDLNKLVRFNFIFSLVHIFIILVVVIIPKDIFKEHSRYSEMYLFTDTDKICEKLDKIDGLLFTSDYTSSALFSYQCKKDIKMLFNNSKYGRMDDKLLDVRTLDQKTFYLYDVYKPKEKEYEGVCTNYSIELIENLDTDMYLTKCENFNYEEYKSKFLDIQREKFYNIPEFLPKCNCYFLDRYYK